MLGWIHGLLRLQNYAESFELHNFWANIAFCGQPRSKSYYFSGRHCWSHISIASHSKTCSPRPSLVKKCSGIDPDFREQSLTMFSRECSLFWGSRKLHVTPSLFTRWRHPYGKWWIKILLTCDTFAFCSKVLVPKVCEVYWYQCHHKDHLKLLPTNIHRLQ